MKQISLLAALTSAACAAVLLAACGGSDSDEPVDIPDPTLVPASATSSTSAWFAFAKALMTSDSAEALKLSNVSALPTSETEEALSLGL